MFSAQCRAPHAVVPRLSNLKFSLLAIGLLGLAGCGGHEAEVPPEDTMGPNPVLPAPSTSMIPTVNVANAVGWPMHGQPKAAEGLAVAAFASGLDHPRWLYV